MNGRYLAKIGNDTLKVRQDYLPPWAIGDINTDRGLFHLDDNQQQSPAIRAKRGPDVEIEVWEPEGYFLLASWRSDLPIEAVAAEFGLVTLRDYLAQRGTSQRAAAAVTSCATAATSTHWFLCMLTFTLECYGWAALALPV